jgi:hypothetical protein
MSYMPVLSLPKRMVQSIPEKVVLLRRHVHSAKPLTFCLVFGLNILSDERNNLHPHPNNQDVFLIIHGLINILSKMGIKKHRYPHQLEKASQAIFL